ncbi:chascon [Anaeramoeba flamelloides]|uniref:Chascon n=1 Tax=Anaeramoeba flamelloides TaxID=1746091 RepID=A0ABQ8YDI6_9EUKA|nr:chascon [Anaeramoeba flamelloides]
MTELATFNQTRNSKHHHSNRNRRTHHNSKIPKHGHSTYTRLRSREREKEKERIKEENKILVLENEFFKSLNDTKQRIFKIRMNVIIQRICYKEFSEPFLYPVDPVQLNLPTYPQIVKSPMDLSQIEKKLENNEYDLPNQLIGDLNLMINNCILFNGEEHVFSQCGKELLKDFHRSFKKLKIKMNELMCKQCRWLLHHKKKYRPLIGRIEKKQKYLEYVPFKDEKKVNNLNEKKPKIEEEKEKEKEKEKEREKDKEIRVGYQKETNFEQNEKNKEHKIVQNELEGKQKQKETNKIFCNEYFNIKKMFTEKSEYQPKAKRIFQEISFMNEKLQYILKKINSERKLNLPIYGEFSKNKFPYQLFPSFFPIKPENGNISFKKFKENNQSLQEKDSLNLQNKKLKTKIKNTNSKSVFKEKFQNYYYYYYYTYNQPYTINNQKNIHQKEIQIESKFEENGKAKKKKQEQELVKEMEIESTNTGANKIENENENENKNDQNQENQKDKESKMEIEIKSEKTKKSNKIINQKNVDAKVNGNWIFNDGDKRGEKNKFTYEEKKEIAHIINRLDIKKKLKVFRIIEKGLKGKKKGERKRGKMLMGKELNQKNLKFKKPNFGIKIQRKKINQNNELIQKNKEKLQINKSGNNDHSKENAKIMKQNNKNKQNENEKINFHIDLLPKETISELQNYIGTIENFDKILDRNNFNDSKSNKESQHKWPTSVFKEPTNASESIKIEQSSNGPSSLKEEGTLKDDTWTKSFSLNNVDSTQRNEIVEKNNNSLLNQNKQQNENAKNNLAINNDRNNNENSGSHNQNKTNQNNAQGNEPIKNNNDDVNETVNNINRGNAKARDDNNNISISQKVKNNLPNDLLWNGLFSFGTKDKDDDEKQIDKDLWETFQSKKQEEDRKEIEKKQKIQELHLATKKKEELMLHNWKERQAQKEREKEEQEKKLQEEIEKKKKLRESEREKARREREAQANKKSDDEDDDLIQEDDDFGQFGVDDDSQGINWDSMEGKFNFNEDDDEDVEVVENESGSHNINDSSISHSRGEDGNRDNNLNGGSYENSDKNENTGGNNENENFNENYHENGNENENQNENENETNTEFNYEYNDNNEGDGDNDDVDDLEITFDNEEEVNIFGDNAEEDF